jgi:hypothetical protein
VRLGRVIEYPHVHQRHTTWGQVRSAIAERNPFRLFGLASHWNALIQDVTRTHIPSENDRIVEALTTPEPQQLASIRSAAAHFREQGTGYAPVIHRRQLLILLGEALRSQAWDPASDVGVTGPDVVDILLAINEHLEPEESKGVTSEVFAQLLAMWDFEDARSPGAGVVRILSLLRDILPDVRTPSDIPALFNAGNALSLESFCTLAFLAVFLTDQSLPIRKGAPVPVHGDLGLANLTPSQLCGQTTVTLTEARAFLAGLSLPPEQFRLRLSNSGPSQTDFSQFRQYPFVALGSSPEGGEEVFRLVDRTLLANKLTDGPYWDTHQGARMRRESIQNVNASWGLIFEEYCHRLVENTAGQRYVRNPSLDDNDSEDGDGLLVFDDSWVLLEYKFGSLTIPARSGIGSRRAAREIHRKYGHPRGVAQLARVLRRLVTGRDLGGHTFGTHSAVFPVLVAWDSIMSAPLVNCLLQRTFQRLLPQPDRRVRPLTVLSIEDFESMLALADRMPLPAMLETWLAKDPRMVRSPAWVLAEELPSWRAEKHPWLRDAGDRWTTEMLVRLWPNGEAAGKLAKRPRALARGAIRERPTKMRRLAARVADALRWLRGLLGSRHPTSSGDSARRDSGGPGRSVRLPLPRKDAPLEQPSPVDGDATSPPSPGDPGANENQPEPVLHAASAAAPNEAGTGASADPSVIERTPTPRTVETSHSPSPTDSTAERRRSPERARPGRQGERKSEQAHRRPRRGGTRAGERVEAGKRGGRPRGARPASSDEGPTAPAPVKAPALRTRRPELVCWRRGMAWVVAVEMPEDALTADVSVVQGGGTELQEDHLRERRYTLVDPLGAVTAQWTDRETTTRREFSPGDHRVFKLVGSGAEGRAVRTVARGHYVVIAPASLAPRHPEAVSLAPEPVMPGDAGLIAHHLLATIDSDATVLDGPGGVVLEVRPSSADACELVGETIEDARPDAGPLFARAPPRLRARGTAPARVVVGVEGPGAGRRPRRAGASLEELHDWIDAHQPGWFFVRAYDAEDELIDSLDFRYARGLEAIEISQAPPLPAPDGHGPVAVRFRLSPDLELALVDGAVEAGSSGSFVLPARADAGGARWRLRSGAGEGFEVAVRAPRVWWARTSESEPEGLPAWVDRPLSLTAEDLRPTSPMQLAVLLPGPGWANELCVGFRGGVPRRLRVPRSDTVVRCPLRDLGEDEVLREAAETCDLLLSVRHRDVEQGPVVVGVVAPADGRRHTPRRAFEPRRADPAKLMSVLTCATRNGGTPERQALRRLRKRYYGSARSGGSGDREAFARQALALACAALERRQGLRLPARWRRRAEAFAWRDPAAVAEWSRFLRARDAARWARRARR